MISPLFPVQGPFVKAKTEFGYSGVVEYNDEDDTIHCHECGKYFESLGSHLFWVHKTTAAAHKLKFGLLLKMPLCGKKLLAKRRTQMLDPIQQKGRHRLKQSLRKKLRCKPSIKRQHGTQSKAWKNRFGLCDLQMKTRYQLIKDKVKHQPTTREIKQHDAALLSAIERRYKTLNAFRATVGDQPKTAQDYQMSSHQEIIASLQDWKEKNGRIPRWRDFIKANPPYPQATTVCAYFGSWKNALVQAGLCD